MCFPPRWEHSMQGEHLLGSHRCQNEYLGLGSITSLVSSTGFIFFFPNGARGEKTEERAQIHTNAWNSTCSRDNCSLPPPTERRQ